jgi:hypothetical protein
VTVFRANPTGHFRGAGAYPEARRHPGDRPDRIPCGRGTVTSAAAPARSVRRPSPVPRVGPGVLSAAAWSGRGQLDARSRIPPAAVVSPPRPGRGRAWRSRMATSPSSTSIRPDKGGTAATKSGKRREWSTPLRVSSANAPTVLVCEQAPAVDLLLVDPASEGRARALVWANTAG